MARHAGTWTSGQSARRAMAAFALAAGAALLPPASARGQEKDDSKLGRSIALPMTIPDGAGGVWMIQMNGLVIQQGNMPSFGQVGMLTVNGAGLPMRMINPAMPGGNGLSARIDDKTGELTISNMMAGNIIVTRRILFDKEAGTVRYVDTLKNPANADAQAAVQYFNTVNFGIQQSKLVGGEGKRRGSPTGWAANSNGRGLFSAWGFTGAKVVPRVQAMDGGNSAQAAFTVTVPAGGEVSLLHVHGSTDRLESAESALAELKVNKLVSVLPADVRRTLVNLPARTSAVALNLELLRGDTTDVLETTDGDKLLGKLADGTFSLKTSFGQLELPAEKVAGLLVAGKESPTQLVVTREGEVFSGTLAQGVSVVLASGQTVMVPLPMFARAGYRRAAGETADITPLVKPWVALRSGARLAIAPPGETLAFESRFGTLTIPAAQVTLVQFRKEDASAQLVTLADGSRFLGTLKLPEFKFSLDGAAGRSEMTVPTAELLALSLSTWKDDDTRDEKRAAELRLTIAPPTMAEGGGAPDATASGAASGATPGSTTTSTTTSTTSPTTAPASRRITKLAKAKVDDDESEVLYGTLKGNLQLATSYQTVDLLGTEIRSIKRAEGKTSDSASESRKLKVTMWDGSIMSGVLQGSSLPITLASGLEIAVPVEALASYENPAPRPSASMGDSVKALVALLNDDDFKKREAAQKELATAGPVIAPLLKELREGLPVEAQQRVDQVLAGFEK